MTGIHPEMSLEEVAGHVSEGLRKRGISAVLTGGAVVTIYSRNAYVSDDLDFIVEGIAKRVDEPMREMGFERGTDGRHWVHPESRLWVEFPAGPLEVGDSPVTHIDVRATPAGELRLLPPTECVMDRLAGFYHWKDPQSLEQAIAVATRQSVDLDRIREWSVREGKEDRYQVFLRRLKEPRGGGTK